MKNLGYKEAITPTSRETLFIGFAWWNTALSPSKAKERATSTDIEVAIDVIRGLIGVGLNFIVLGEVSEINVRKVEIYIKNEFTEYNIALMNDTIGRTVFDTAVIYRKDIFEIQDRRSVLHKEGRRTFKLAQRLKIRVNGETNPFYIFVSHWPSRLHLDEKDPVRLLLGRYLREAVDEILTVDKNSNVVLLGDYNDEPFDVSLAKGLRTTRDREFARKNGNILYNPFWRHMSSFDQEGVNLKSLDPGTYFYIDGDLTNWHTFDQMLFSPSLLSLLQKSAQSEIY
jgi:hypothetical protein